MLKINKKKSVFIWGNKYFTDIIANILKKKYSVINGNNYTFYKNIYNILKSDVMYGILSGYDIKYWILGLIFGKKKVCHWGGTGANVNSLNTSTKIKGYLDKYIIDTHLSNSKDIKSVLKKSVYKLNTEIIHINVIDKNQISKYFKPYDIPNSHSILVYLPKGRESVYNKNIMFEIIGIFKEIEFYIVSHDGGGLEYRNNVKFMGKISQIELFKISF